jgi:hypothetical protein
MCEGRDEQEKNRQRVDESNVHASLATKLARSENPAHRGSGAPQRSIITNSAAAWK